VYLHASEDVLLQRVGARKGHYMGANMVHSQLEVLEEPAKEETDVISIDVNGTKEEVEAEVLWKVKLVQMELVRDS
jgi:gluconokinase